MQAAGTMLGTKKSAEDIQAEALAMHQAGLATEHAAKVAALSTNKLIIKAAKLANRAIAADISRCQSKDPNERRTFGRQSDDFKSKAKKAASQAVAYAKTHMTDLTQDIAGGDLTLPHHMMPVFTLRLIDDGYITGCSDLEAHDKNFNFFWV